MMIGQKRSAATVELTDAQTVTLEKLPVHRILEQLENGAVIICPARVEAGWMVVDSDGKVHGFNHYLSVFSKPV
jgi:hypothetical protein